MNGKPLIMTVQISVKVTNQTYETLKKLSSKENKPIAEIIRQFIEKGLSLQSYKDDTNFIRIQIREEMTSILKPSIDRIIKICVKSGIVSAAGYFLNAQALSEFINPSRQKEFSKSLEESKKMGVAYFKLKDKEIEEFYKSDKEN